MNKSMMIRNNKLVRMNIIKIIQNNKLAIMNKNKNNIFPNNKLLLVILKIKIIKKII